MIDTNPDTIPTVVALPSGVMIERIDDMGGERFVIVVGSHSDRAIMDRAIAAANLISQQTASSIKLTFGDRS